MLKGETAANPDSNARSSPGLTSTRGRRIRVGNRKRAHESMLLDVIVFNTLISGSFLSSRHWRNV